MEIVRISDQTIKIKGKQVTLLVNAVAEKKNAADVVLFFERMSEDFDSQAVEGLKLLIDGPGEYEVGGVKIAGEKSNNAFYYLISVDGVDILVGKASAFVKPKELGKDVQVVCLLSDALVNQPAITAFNSTVLVFFGEKAIENSRALGKEDVAPVSKYIVTRDKLPSDGQIVILG